MFPHGAQKVLGWFGGYGFTAQGEVRRTRVTLRTQLARDLPRVIGDRVQLQQVVLNLVLNGLEAMGAVAAVPNEGPGATVLFTV